MVSRATVVLLSYHPIFLLPYHILKLVSFLGTNRTKAPPLASGRREALYKYLKTIQYNWILYNAYTRNALLYPRRRNFSNCWTQTFKIQPAPVCSAQSLPLLRYLLNSSPRLTFTDSIGRVDAFRPDGRWFESRSSRHVGTLSKSFTYSCL